MARSLLTGTMTDLIQDSGSVLWSFVKGEQLEFPILLNFVNNASIGYDYEAVVIEAANIAEDPTVPINTQPGGVQTKLVVRVPVNRGNWLAAGSYNREEIVVYENKWYKLLQGVGRVSDLPPSEDPYWAETVANRVYVQFPQTLGYTWAVQPSVGFPTYGFFELRVTDTRDSIFKRTWKPIRGMVQILFSPTDAVPD